jgi:UDPglucose 6-dehydrogenase
MKITIAGAGYVGLVTAVSFAEIGYKVTCFDTDEQKINMLANGDLPLYEPGMEEMITKNTERLTFTSNPDDAYAKADFVFVCVGTPEQRDGSVKMDYFNEAVMTIKELGCEAIVVIKSTVPVGTNKAVSQKLEMKLVSNPEFLREGSGILDTFHADRIVIGSEDAVARRRVADFYKAFNLPILETDSNSAELIKYASNAFLATKISFINEIAHLCEHTDANIEDVARGMGMDKRIGNQFLNAGIGYGGSCFPKDTKALEKLTEDYDYDFKILRAVIEVNSNQKAQLYSKAKRMLGNLAGKRAVVLGLSFKPHTDDIREAPALELIATLLADQAEVSVYDPVAMKKVEELFGDKLYYGGSIDEAIKGADLVFIMTEWPQITNYALGNYSLYMRRPLVLDGRNCYDLNLAKQMGLEYISIGRRAVHGHQRFKQRD